MDVVVMSDDELAVGLRTWSARVAADTAELLRMLGEFDARVGRRSRTGSCER